MMNWLNIRGLKNINAVYIKHHLQHDWELKPSPNSNAYIQYQISPNSKISGSKSRGRFYQVSHQFLLNFDEIDE